MGIAIKYGAMVDDPIVDDDGKLAIRGGAGALVERLLKIYPGACLVGYEDRQCDGFEMKRDINLDAEKDLVINLDVMDSVGVFQVMHRHGAEPMIMNLQWLPPRHYHHKVNFAAMGLSYALFPTLCSGERTAAEVSELTHRWTIPALANSAQIAWFQPGIRDDLLQPRVDTEVPEVLYPSIHLDAEKHPQQFMQIVTEVAAKVPLQMVARLAPRDLVSLQAMRMSSAKWTTVGPLSADREGYWGTLAHTTAFLSTATAEAYGLEELEALVAGVIGVMPKLPWVEVLVPTGYPYLYNSDAEAAMMLENVLRDPKAARRAIDESAGGSIKDWVFAKHARAAGNEAIENQVKEWFPKALED